MSSLDLQYLYDIISVSPAFNTLRVLLVSDFSCLVFICLNFSLTALLLVGIPQTRLPYNKIGSMCLSRSDSETILETRSTSHYGYQVICPQDCVKYYVT